MDNERTLGHVDLYSLIDRQVDDDYGSFCRRHRPSPPHHHHHHRCHHHHHHGRRH